MSDQIKHVKLLILENRSFDHMLGDLRQHNTQIDGIDPGNPKTNTHEGVVYRQEAGAARFVSIPKA